LRTPAHADPSDEREEAILAATLRILARGGLADVTHRAVAKEAEVSLGVITYRFASRDALLEAALHYCARREIATLDALAAELTRCACDADTWIASFSQALAHRLRREREEVLAGFEMVLGSARHPSLRRGAREANEAYERIALVALRVARARDPEAQAPLLCATIKSLMLDELARPSRGFETALRDHLRTLITAFTR
jgi:AcrR family transcriptional regulator